METIGIFIIGVIGIFVVLIFGFFVYQRFKPGDYARLYHPDVYDRDWYGDKDGQNENRKNLSQTQTKRQQADPYGKQNFSV